MVQGSWVGDPLTASIILFFLFSVLSFIHYVHMNCLWWDSFTLCASVPFLFFALLTCFSFSFFDIGAQWLDLGYSTINKYISFMVLIPFQTKFDILTISQRALCVSYSRKPFLKLTTDGAFDDLGGNVLHLLENGSRPIPTCLVFVRCCNLVLGFVSCFS